MLKRSGVAGVPTFQNDINRTEDARLALLNHQNSRKRLAEPRPNPPSATFQTVGLLFVDIKERARQQGAFIGWALSIAVGNNQF